MGLRQTPLKPLTELGATDRYKGEDGGLYGGGKNEPPARLREAAQQELAQIRPRDDQGKPTERGRIVLISLSMSNATMEFSHFKRLADPDPAKSPRLTIVDGAQGGQAMAEWVPRDAPPWSVAEQRLAQAQVTPAQVQVAWVKLANKGPRGDLQEHGRKLQRDTRAVLDNARERFPNLRFVYLSSRINASYATSALNPEPYAYESAFAARWLILDQLRSGAIPRPLLLWGPYLWASQTTPRKADGLLYTREDFAADGTHPSKSGQEKVAQQLLSFFKTDVLAKNWFLR